MSQKKNPLENTLKNIYNNHPNDWGKLSREAERLLTNSTDEIKHEFYSQIDPSDIIPYLKSSMPQAAVEEIDRTSRNISPFRGATMLIEKVFRYDDSFYQFLAALIKSKQGDLVDALLRRIVANLPNLRGYLPQRAEHGSLHTPPNTEVQGSAVPFASNPNTVDHRARVGQQQPASADLYSEANTVDSHLNRQPGVQPHYSTYQSGVQMSHRNDLDQVIAAGGGSTMSTSGSMLSAPHTVDDSLAVYKRKVQEQQQQIQEQEQQIQEQEQQMQEQQQQIQVLQQEVQGLRRDVGAVYGSMENFQDRVRRNIPPESTSVQAQADEFTSEDYASNNA